MQLLVFIERTMEISLHPLIIKLRGFLAAWCHCEVSVSFFFILDFWYLNTAEIESMKLWHRSRRNKLREKGLKNLRKKKIVNM